MQRGTKHTQESIEKMREKKVGKKRTPEQRAKIAEAMRLRWQAVKGTR